MNQDEGRAGLPAGCGGAVGAKGTPFAGNRMMLPWPARLSGVVMRNRVLDSHAWFPHQIPMLDWADWFILVWFCGALLYLRKKAAGGAEPDWDLKKQSDLEEPSPTRKNEPEFLGQEGAGGGTL
jgi:hypothetical protein